MPADHASPVIGVDVGGTNMQIGLLDHRDIIAGRSSMKTGAEHGTGHVIDTIREGVNEACSAAGCRLADVAAIGVAAAGAIDIPRGVVLVSPNLGWRNLPLRALLRERLGRPVVLENDVNGAVWGEYQLGAGEGRGEVLGIWIGTGVGGGLILNGRIYHGEFHTAGEIGHTVIRPDAPFGERTVEDLCSRTGMRRRLVKLMPEHANSVLHRFITGREVIETSHLKAAYEEEDALVSGVVNEAADLLGIAIANQVTVLALDTVIIGGGITEALGNPYLQRIRHSFEASVFPPESRACRLVATTLAADAGLLGAALLAREAIDRPDLTR